MDTNLHICHWIIVRLLAKDECLLMSTFFRNDDFQFGKRL